MGTWFAGAVPIWMTTLPAGSRMRFNPPTISGRDGMIMRVKHVYRQRKRRNGVVVAEYWRHRITGERLDIDEKGNPRTPEQVAQRGNEINAGLDRRKQGKGFGTLASLIARYQSSPDFTRLRESTRREYTRIMGDLEKRKGSMAVSSITRESILNMRDALSSRPRKADSYVAMMSILLQFALDRPKEFGTTQNAAHKIRRIHRAGESYPTWPEPLIKTVLQDAPDPIRWAVAVAL